MTAYASRIDTALPLAVTQLCTTPKRPWLQAKAKSAPTPTAMPAPAAAPASCEPAAAAAAAAAALLELGERVAVGEKVGETVGEALGVALGDGVGEGEREGVGELEGDAEGKRRQSWSWMIGRSTALVTGPELGFAGSMVTLAPPQ